MKITKRIKARPTIGVAILLFTIVAGGLIWSRTRRSVSIRFGNHGLSSIRYHGQELLARGDFRVNQVVLRRGTRAAYPGELFPVIKFDPKGKSVYQTFVWGTVAVKYTTARNRLDVDIVTTNRSSAEIEGLYYEPFVLRFPRKPAEYDGVTPMLAHNVGSPSILSMSFGDDKMVLVNEDVSRPVIFGMPWALNKPSNTEFPVRLNTAPDSMYPDSLPQFVRTVAPGRTDRFHFSLRFGAKSDSETTLASDICNRFASAFPNRLQWSDRRPIGTLSLASNARLIPANPRGWLNDTSIDVTTPEGLEHFRKRMLAFAEDAVTILEDMDAQGMLTWDIEGEQFPQAVYIGDPRQTFALAPEMQSVADDYFRIFRESGFRVGVCVRPQSLVKSPDGKMYQITSGDPGSELFKKISWAHDRWGATIFYIAYNGEPGRPLDASALARILKAYPDVLLIPEHKNLEYYAYAAPYGDLRQGTTSTPSLAHAVYPGSFSVINTADGDLELKASELRAGVKSGDILMYRSWYPDPANAKVRDIYQTSGRTSSVSLQPASGSEIAGTENPGQ
jgi:hypothetical protein